MMFGSSFWGWLADNYGRKFVSFLNIVEPLLSGPSLGEDSRLLNRGSLENTIGGDPVFSLSHISTKYEMWRKSRTIMVIKAKS